MSEQSMSSEQWLKAKIHLDDCIEAYRKYELHPSVDVTFALNAVLNPLKRRYDSGERTDELFNLMIQPHDRLEFVDERILARQK